MHVKPNRPYHVLFVCLLAPFSSSSDRFQSLRDYFTPSDVEDAAKKKVVKSLNLLDSCFVLFSWVEHPQFGISADFSLGSDIL